MSPRGLSVGRGSSVLADQVRERIVAGDYALGRFLPPVRELSTEHGVSPETVRRGLKALEAEGLLRCVPRHGFRVLGRANDPARACPIAYVTSYRREMATTRPTDRALGAAFGEATSEREWSLITMHTASLPASAVIEKLRIARAWGVILDTVDEKLIRVVKRLDIPCVMVNAWSEHVQMDTVIQDNYRGGFLAAEELARREMKRIAWFGPVQANCHSRERYAGAVAGLLASGVELPASRRCEVDPGGGELDDKAMALLSGSDRPHGVIALWTDAARAIKRAADELGLAIGRDLHLVGWSAREHYESEYRAAFEPASPPPAVVWSVASMADTALARLAERRANPQLERVRVSIPTSLCAGEED